MRLYTNNNFHALILLLLGVFAAWPRYSYSEHLDYYVVDELAAPFQISDPNAKQKGFITEVVEALADKLEMQLATHVTPSPRIQKILADETQTNWITYDSPAWNSVPNAVYLDTPLLKVTHSAVHCNHSHVFENKLEGHSFAVLKHFEYPALSRLALEGKIELVPVKSYKQGFALVDLGRVHGFIEMDTRLKYNITLQDQPPECTSISSIGDTEPEYEIVLAVSKSMSATRIKLLNQALKDLQSDDFLEQTLEKYTK